MLFYIHPAKCTPPDQSTPKELTNDDYFMATALLAGLRSKNPKTKVTCILCNHYEVCILVASSTKVWPVLNYALHVRLEHASLQNTLTVLLVLVTMECQMVVVSKILR